MASFLVLFLLFSFGACQEPVGVTPLDVCQASTGCQNCTMTPGCNWCFSGMSKSYCTNIQNAKEANCDMSNCATDKFVTKVSDCYGGCTKADKCSTCQGFVGCKWCHKLKDGKSGMCMESPSMSSKDSDMKMMPSQCEIWSDEESPEGVCAEPCETRSNCKNCLINNNFGKNQIKCAWCTGENFRSSCKTPNSEDILTKIQNGTCLTQSCNFDLDVPQSTKNPAKNSAFLPSASFILSLAAFLFTTQFFL